MTETKTPDPDCADCGGTGFVPPFMDPCFCEKLFHAHSVTIAPVPVHGPAIGTVTNTVDLLGNLVTNVWTGSEWKPIETEALTPAEYAARYGHTASTPDSLPPVIPTMPTWICDRGDEHDIDLPCDCPADEDEDEGAAWDVAKTDIEAAEAAAYAAAAADVDAADAEADFGTVYTDDVVKATVTAAKTSADTFADLVAACESIPTPKTTHTMSASQEALLAKLIAERDPANAVVASVTSALLTSVDKKRASRLIDALMTVPADPARKGDRENGYDGICRDCKGAVPAHTGVIRKIDGRWVTFHRSGDCLSAEAKAALEADAVVQPGLYKHEIDGDMRVFRVRKARTSDRLYAELVIPHGDGEVSFAYNAKAMAWLRASNRLTWAEARDFGAAFGACVACGRTLSDPRSLVQGYGATCAGHYHWPTVTAKQAEAIIAVHLTWEDVISGLGVLTS